MDFYSLISMVSTYDIYIYIVVGIDLYFYTLLILSQALALVLPLCMSGYPWTNFLVIRIKSSGPSYSLKVATSWNGPREYFMKNQLLAIFPSHHGLSLNSSSKSISFPLIPPPNQSTSWKEQPSIKRVI